MALTGQKPQSTRARQAAKVAPQVAAFTWVRHYETVDEWLAGVQVAQAIREIGALTGLTVEAKGALIGQVAEADARRKAAQAARKAAAAIAA